MPTYTLYRLATGRIIGTLPSEDTPETNWFEPGTGWLQALNPAGDNSAEYHVTGSPAAITPRPALAATLDKPFIVANGTDQATLAGIPAGAIIEVRDVHKLSRYTADGTALEITADESGDIVIEVESFPFRRARLVVTAT